MAHIFTCTHCGHLGKPNTTKKGSTGVSILLWLFFLIPGLIYSVWRISTRHSICHKCGSSTLIPTDSPLAKKTLSDQGMNETQIAEAVVKAQSEEKSYELKGGGTILGILILIIIIIIASSGSKNKTRITQPTQTVATRCLSVPQSFVDGIAQGLDANGVVLHNAKAVKSNSFSKVYFVSLELDGDGLENKGDIATFAANNIESGGVFSVDAVANEFFDWGDGRTTDAHFNSGDDGYRESRECVSKS